MNNPVLMRVGERCQRLACQVELDRSRRASLDAIGERFNSELHRNHEVIVDVTRVKHREYVRVPQPRRDAHLVEDLVVAGFPGFLGQFERDLDLLDRVAGAVDVRERPARDTTENAVLADALPSPEHGQPPVRTRRTASFQPCSRRSRCAPCMAGSNNASRCQRRLSSAGDATTPASNPAR